MDIPGRVRLLVPIGLAEKDLAALNQDNSAVSIYLLSLRLRYRNRNLYYSARIVMIETLTLITLSILLLIYFRPGKTPPLDNMLVIERPGHYRVTLAAQLNLAQPFIEAIATEIGAPLDANQHSRTLCFEVRDKQVTAHGHRHYLLAITQRDGMLYFQAAAPRTLTPDTPCETLMEFSSSVMANVRLTGTHDIALDERIVSAVKITAYQRQIEIKNLNE